MKARLPLARRTKLACRHTALTAPRQLDLVLDDVRFRAMAPTERRAVLKSDGTAPAQGEDASGRFRFSLFLSRLSLRASGALKLRRRHALLGCSTGRLTIAK